jgi:hypothetical protein
MNGPSSIDLEAKWLASFIIRVIQRMMKSETVKILLKVQLRLQAEGQRFDKISYLVSERRVMRDEKRPDKAQKDTSLWTTHCGWLLTLEEGCFGASHERDAGANGYPGL